MDLNKLLKTQWDRAGAIGFTVLGAVFLLLGWIGVSGTAFIAEQAPYIVSGGIGGVFLLGIGATLWVSADLRDEWRKLDRIEAAIGEGVLRWAEDDAPAPAVSRQPRAEVLPESPEHAEPLALVNGSGKAKAARTASTPRTTASTTAAARTRRPAAARPRVKASAHDA